MLPPGVVLVSYAGQHQTNVANIPKTILETSIEFGLPMRYHSSSDTGDNRAVAETKECLEMSESQTSLGSANDQESSEDTRD